MNKAETVSTSQPVATVEMCIVCFDALVHKLQSSNVTIQFNDAQYDNLQCPLFVTWDIYNRKNQRWELRGCIGSLSAVPLTTGVTQYAITAALHDKRFRPITFTEVPALRVSISLLVQYETCDHVYDWIVGQHGITITWTEDKPDHPAHTQKLGRKYSATYLPEVAAQQQWTHSQTVDSLIRKAGYTGKITPAILERIHCTRYQSSKCTTEFAHYQALLQQQQTHHWAALSALQQQRQPSPAIITPEGSTGSGDRDACHVM